MNGVLNATIITVRSNLVAVVGTVCDGAAAGARCFSGQADSLLQRRRSGA